MSYIDKCDVLQEYELTTGALVEIRPASFADLQKVSELLETIQITEANLDIKLSMNHKDSFYKRGGFFAIWSVEKLARIIEDETNLVLIAVAKEKDKDVLCGFLWCRIDVNKTLFNSYNLNNSSLTSEQLQRFRLAHREERVFTAVECVVLPKYQGMGVSFAIIYETYQWLRNRGFLFLLLDVYVITGEYIDDRVIEMSLPNLASINHIKKYNAVYIGSRVMPETLVGSRRFRVEAELYLLDLQFSLAILKELVAQHTITTALNSN